MTEIDARLSQLRDAADKLRESGHRIDYAVTNVTITLQELVALGYTGQLPAASGKLSMHEWAALLISFGRKLGDAAADIEDALRSRASFNIEDFEPLEVEHSRHVWVAGGWRLPARDPFAGLTQPDQRAHYTIDDFVSGRNREAYETLVLYRDELADQQSVLTGLVSERNTLTAELAALKDRLKSYNPSMNVDTVPRVVAMQNDLDALNGQINDIQRKIDGLQSDIASIEDNLMRVKPGDGADLTLIKQLEQAKTSDWIKAHTEDCVNYIVHKVPIPAKIPVDAYRWDDVIADAPEYGITVGDKPLVGSVIQMEREHTYADDRFGHLMYVERVENGVIWVTDNDHPLPVRLSDLTDELTGENIRYLYFPWHTRA